ncbi:MAG: hypothetical protein ACJ8M1_10325 [Chthoniobacterales bacterium]
MSTRPSEEAISNCRTIESLQRALDHGYRGLLDRAKADWQRLFGGYDPSDSCVSVRISDRIIAEELTGTPHGANGVRRKNARRRRR